MKTEEIIAHIENMQNEINNSHAWNSARKMVINYLTIHFHLEDPYQWANKTIELLSELKEIKRMKEDGNNL